VLITRRAVSVAVLLVAASSLHARQESAAPAKVELQPAEMEDFLRHGRIERTYDAGVGITDSRRARISHNGITHDAHIQDVDVTRSVQEAGARSEVGFKDSYRFNIAAYRLARLLGLDNVPMSVERVVGGKSAAVTWWVDDVMMDDKDRLGQQGVKPEPDPLRTDRQLQVMRVFDELIQNRDRNQGNILWTSDWKLWMIDHTRAFRLGTELLKPEAMLWCERGLLSRLRLLTRDTVAQAVDRTLDRREIDALLARRDLIVRHFDERIAARGEDNVLFTLTP
jgi:hypothetical protein